MTQHTPGPWKTRVWNSNGFPLAVQTHDGGILASIWQYGTMRQTKATARLIAAAPDLLEALDNIMYANDTPPGASMGEAKVCEHYARIARAAIAKARGATS